MTSMAISLGGGILRTATIPLHGAAEEAWMSINRLQADPRPLAELDEAERLRLGAGG